MTDLQRVKKIVLPESCALEVLYHLRAAGRQEVEGVALWAGHLDAATFTVKHTVIPKQTPLRLPTGLLYVVDEAELHRLNVWLYRSRLTLVAQIHSHPTVAYHSDIDDMYPIVTAVGGLSIVVPNFARGALDLSSWAVFRLTEHGEWCELSWEDSSTLIQLSEG